MRSFATVLAAAVAVIASAQVPDVDVSSCDNNLASGSLYNVGAATGSEWECVQFSVVPEAGKLMRVTVPSSMMGNELQLVAYNKFQDDAAGSDNMWTSSGDGFLTVVLPQKGANDEDNLPSTWSSAAYDNYTESVGMSGISARTGSNHPSNGVYAYRGSIEELRPGTTTLVVRYPSTATSGSAFRGVLLYRFVNPWNGATSSVDSFNGGSLSSSSIASAFGSLSVGGTVTISDVLMPGDSVALPINEEFARIGYALRGLRYEVSLTQTMNSGSAASNLATDRLGWINILDLPSGYSSAGDGADKSFNTDNGLSTGVYQGVDGSTTQSYYFDYSQEWGAWNGTISYGGNTITRQWQFPLDRSSTGFSASTLSITLPLPRDTLGNTEVVAWEGQSSPFWTLAVTLVSVDTYPMLGSESAVTLKNFDTNEDNGHSRTTPGTQDPFKVYMARVSTPYWWRIMPTFSGVVNLNAVDGGSTSDACMPRVEFQVINRNGNIQPNGWNPTVSTAWSNFGNLAATFSDVSTEPFYPTYYTQGGQDMQMQTPAMTNDKWYNAGSNAPASSMDDSYTMVPSTTVSDDMWLMVRVSAARRTLVNSAGAAPSTADCGSNNIRIGSMGMIVDTIIDQCSSYKDCAVDGGDNPNKDQKSDSANNDDSRFSNCYVKRTVGPNFVAVPTTKCMECNTDQHCRSGQYCHMDDGICNSGSRYYSCDSKSGEKYGVCREKSSDVLGKQCRHSSRAQNGGFDNDIENSGVLTSGGFQSAFSRVPTYLNSYGVSVETYMGQDSRAIVKGDADGKGFAKGAFGACGEYVFYEAGFGGSSPSSGVRGALWQGFCTSDQKCVECIPGSTNGFGSDGKTCLNGKSYAAMDVDGTVRTFAENTAAGSILGTTSMVLLLVFLFAFYMYAEARRHRQAHGLPDLTCCECLLCCGACSKAPVPTKKTSNPVAA